jgi:peptidoglycan hydrolase CwlO-like protein
VKDPRSIRLTAILAGDLKTINGSRSLKLVAMLAICSLCWFSGRASAYNASIYNSLSRSRDALLTQRSHLKDAAAEVQTKINELQGKMDSINSYLSDTDNALRDVESAMARAN